MTSNFLKFSTAAIVSVAFVGATLTATPVHAKKFPLGAAILGGIVGGMIAGNIRRCHSHGGYRHCHRHVGNHNHYRGGIIYAPVQPPVYVPPPVYRAPVGYPAAHYRWCYNTYRSYHQPSNTFQPFGGGPRRICRSPWGG
ncbi:MAG: BA14K family protein [Hyphomicrobiales bacterium]|nr:BA14K family protein [Hyphomicrobiales bacterium]